MKTWSKPIRKARAATAKDASNRNSGHALLLSAMLGVMAFALWIVAFRATQDALGLAASESDRERRMVVLTEAMTRAGHLLETGVPPRTGYRCVSRHRVEAGEWQAVTLKFSQSGSEDRWEVDAQFASQRELAKLPPAPVAFKANRAGR